MRGWWPASTDSTWSWLCSRPPLSQIVRSPSPSNMAAVLANSPSGVTSITAPTAPSSPTVICCPSWLVAAPTYGGRLVR